MQDAIFVLSVPVDSALKDSVSRVDDMDDTNDQQDTASCLDLSESTRSTTESGHAAHAAYTLRGPEVVFPAQEDVVYRATIRNDSDAPLALRAQLCCGGNGNFVVQRTSLLETAQNSGAFVALEEKSSAILQGILWAHSDQFVWELVGDVSETVEQGWQTRLIIQASYLANKDSDSWVELDLPVVDVKTNIDA